MSGLDEKAFGRAYEVSLLPSDRLRIAIRAYLASVTPVDVGEEPVAYLDADGNLSATLSSPIADIIRALPDPPVGRKLLPLYSATALERVVRKAVEAREHIRKQADDIMTLGQLVYADTDTTWKARATSAEAKLAEALARLETVEAETRERCARELSLRRLALDHQTEVLDIAREMDIYDICIEAIRNLEPRHD